mmetsp:Transcript_8943/g.22753  ORF Transcript_8943/g.22753 Transcript_8943/m.22753 type:complete len:218 (-) Transcript_8943:341-994(-)
MRANWSAFAGTTRSWTTKSSTRKSPTNAASITSQSRSMRATASPEKARTKRSFVVGTRALPGRSTPANPHMAMATVMARAAAAATTIMGLTRITAGRMAQARARSPRRSVPHTYSASARLSLRRNMGTWAQACTRQHPPHFSALPTRSRILVLGHPKVAEGGQVRGFQSRRAALRRSRIPRHSKLHTEHTSFQRKRESYSGPSPRRDRTAHVDHQAR